MRRSIWKWLAVAALLAVVLAASAATGLKVYLQHRNQQWLSAAEDAYAKGEWQLAKNLYERYLPQDTENAVLLKKYGDACRRILANRTSALQSAGVAYLQILSFDPDNKDVRTQLLDLYRNMGSWGNLEYYTQTWLGSNPRDPELQYNHALALDRLGRRDEAMDAYWQLVKENTGPSDVYANLARLLRDRGLDMKAEDVFRDALAMRPNDARVRVDYARYIARTKNWDRVDALLTEAMRLDPKDPQVLMAMGQTASLRQDYDQAVGFLQQAVAENPQEPTASLLLAGVYVAKGDNEQAVEVLKRLDPAVQVDTPAVLITLCDLQLSLKQFDAAHETVAVYSTAYPGQLPIEEYFSAKELLVKGDAAGAVKKLASVVELRPNFLQAQYTLAIAYLESGDPELARNALEAYIAKNPNDVRAQVLLKESFGRPLTFEAAIARAHEVQREPNADAETLFAAGAALYDAAQRRGALNEQGHIVTDLLTRSLAKDAKRFAAYQGLIEVELARQDLDSARRWLDEAAAAGVSESDLAKARAAVALAGGDTALAKRIADDALASPSATAADYIGWADYLASHGQYEMGLALLSGGSTRFPDSEGRLQMELERVSLAILHGGAGRALEWLEPLDNGIAKDSPLRRRYNTVRLQLVQNLLSDPDSGQDQSIKSIVDQVRAEEPDNPVLQTIDGFLLLQEEPPKLAEAEALFKQAASANPRNVNGQWGLARVALAKEDYPQALTYTERAAALAPESMALQLQLGEILTKLGRRLEAENAFNRVLAENPNNLAALRMLAINLIDRNQARQASRVLDQLEQALKGVPGQAGIVEDLRGRLLLAEGSKADAERLLRARYEAHPDDLATLQSLAAAVYDQGRRDEATGMLNSYAEKHAADPEVWVALAQFYLALDDRDQLEAASTALTRALIADPDSIPALREMLNVRLRQGNRVEAQGLCDRYLRENPDSPDMLNTMASLLMDVPGQLREAEDAANRAISLDERPEYLATRGDILLAKGDPKGALTDLQAAERAMASSTAQMDLSMAQACLATGNLAMARKYYDSAVQKAAQGESLNQERLSRFGEALKRREPAA